MSDPDHSGPYICCGPMTLLELSHVYDGGCAWYCPACGCWRHRFSPGDSRRAKVTEWMEQHAASLIDERGEVGG